ncbi:MAG: extracellular solute-binding protein, partial [Clostridiales bacterium]|nr:extracellular solute-binding protein [Clostridiales bacterium]
MRNQRNQKNQRNKQSLKSLKKPLPMLMAAALALALLAGCGSTASPPATSTAASVTTASEAPDSGAQDSDSPDSDSPDSASPDSGAQGSAAESAAPAADTAPAPALDEATIKIYLTGDAPKYLDEVWNNVADKSKGVLNAKFAVNYIPWSDYADKMTMLAASGDDFDLYFDANWLIWPTMVKNGALLGLNDLFDQYAPNLKAYLEAPGLLEWAKVNGEFMGVPIDDAGTQRPIVAIREDLRVKYDLPDSMATMEELEAYLDVVTANEDIRAINNIIQANMWDNALFAIACKYSLEREFGQGNFDLTYYLTDEKVTIVPMERTEAFREASVIRERWYQKGWIPQNAMNDTETVALLNDGKYAASIRGVQDAAGGITSGPGEAKTYVMYPDSLASIGGTLGNMVCFNRNAKNPERTMMFLEWMNASQE